MSSFFAAGLAWLETDETLPATATAAMSVTTAKPRSNPRIDPPLIPTRHRVAAPSAAPGRGVSIGDDPLHKVKPLEPGRAPRLTCDRAAVYHPRASQARGPP